MDISLEATIRKMMVSPDLTVSTSVEKPVISETSENKEMGKILNKKKKRTQVIINPPVKEGMSSEEEWKKAILDPYGALADPNRAPSLVNIAMSIIKKRMDVDESLLLDEEEYDEAMGLDEAVTLSKKKKDIDRVKAENMQEGRDWHVKNPVNHMNVVNAYLDSSDKDKEFGKNWYSDAHKLTKFLAKGSGHSVHTTAGIISNHSPQNGIYQNYHDAVRVLDAGHGLGGTGSGVMATNLQKGVDDKLFAGMNHQEALKGNKTKAFAHLLEHGKQTDPSNPRVVIDRHAHSVLSGHRITNNAFGMAGMKRKGRYQELEYHFMKASEHLEKHHGVSIEPHQLQAATWAWRQRKNQEEEERVGKMPSSKTAKKQIHSKGRWNEFAGKRFQGQTLPPVPGHGFEEREPEPEHQAHEYTAKHVSTPKDEEYINDLKPWEHQF